MSTRLRWSDRPLDRWDRLVDPGQISTRPLDLEVFGFCLDMVFCLMSPSDDVLRILCKTRYVVCCGDTLVPLTTLFGCFACFTCFAVLAKTRPRHLKWVIFWSRGSDFSTSIQNLGSKFLSHPNFWVVGIFSDFGF